MDKESSQGTYRERNRKARQATICAFRWTIIATLRAKGEIFYGILSPPSVENTRV